jgi:hypothetical protein
MTARFFVDSMENGAAIDRAYRYFFMSFATSSYQEGIASLTLSVEPDDPAFQLRRW